MFTPPKGFECFHVSLLASGGIMRVLLQISCLMSVFIEHKLPVGSEQDDGAISGQVVKFWKWAASGARMDSETGAAVRTHGFPADWFVLLFPIRTAGHEKWVASLLFEKKKKKGLRKETLAKATRQSFSKGLQAILEITGVVLSARSIPSISKGKGERHYWKGTKGTLSVWGTSHVRFVSFVNEMKFLIRMGSIENRQHTVNFFCYYCLFIVLWWKWNATSCIAVLFFPIKPSVKSRPFCHIFAD